MAQIEQVVVSTRVISTLCHLLVLVIVIFTREANIEVGLSDSPSDDRKRWAHDSTFVRLLFCKSVLLLDIVVDSCCVMSFVGGTLYRRVLFLI